MTKAIDLQGAVVAITGGGRGIGLATAQALAARGARVSLGDIDHTLAEDAAKSLHCYGGELDVRDRASFAAFLDATRKALGPIDVLINNAGIMPLNPFSEEPDAITDTQIDINLRGVIHGCKLALPEMLARGKGHIVNTGSLAGVVSLPGAAIYCATKFAVRGLTQTLRHEYRGTGVNFTCIMPSKVTTELSSGSDEAARIIPTVSPQDVAQAIVRSILHRKEEVAVPGYLGSVAALLSLTPSRLERGIRRLINDQRILEKIDMQARGAYIQRVESLARKEVR
ncbi:SDR family oxidoreductase [Burkholderia cenocepacia]|uniref:SDR family oxidoreductase n=1 Tax=Burkholderia cenocepacia TaxID=95486 RepID=UPI002AB1340A|nr:SDR family oxidoreductase [Burkholderia cenocepacia]